MTDSTSTSEPRGLPEQITDLSEPSTLGRTLLRRYAHAGVIRTAGIMARSRRRQAIGAHVTSLSRTLQRRWHPWAARSGLTRPALVFRQGEPAEAARQPSAEVPALQSVLPRVEPAAGRTLPVRVQNAEPVQDTPRSVSVQRRARERLHRLPGKEDEPGVVMTATSGLPVLARQQGPVVYPSAQRAPIRSIDGQLRRSSTRGAATVGLGAAVLRRQEVASGRQLMARQSEPVVTRAAPAAMTVVAARHPHPSAAASAELATTLPTSSVASFGTITTGGREVASTRPLLARQSAAGIPSAAPTGIAVVAARRPHPSDAPGAELASTVPATPSTGLDPAALGGREVAPASPPLARRSATGVPSPAPTGIAVVAARRPHPSTASGAELVSTVQATLSAGLGPATIGGREVAPASPLLARRSAPGVPSPAPTSIAVAAARRPHQSKIMGARQSADTALHTQASRSLVRDAATTTAFGSAMLRAPVRRLARSEDSPAPGISRKPLAAITSPGAATVLGRAEIARGSLPLGIAKMDSKIVVPAQAPQEIVARSALPLAGSINRLPPRDGSSLDDVASAARPRVGSDAIGGTEQRLAPAIARAAETPALHGAPSATALGQTKGQPDRRMPVQSSSGSPVSQRDFDIGQPAVRRLPEAMDSVLPLALSPAQSAGATRQAMAQRAVASPSSVVFTAAETAPASPGAAAGAPPENGASPSPQLDEAHIEQLAERVIDIIERRITIEAESRGLSL